MTRDFTVATFVVADAKVLLLHHKKLQRWLPPGGHIEPNELPDEAAVREVYEEAGIHVELVGERALPVADPRQLLIPRGVQVERIAPDHEHIDFIYFARPVGGTQLRESDESNAIGWFDREQTKKLGLTEEMALWVDKALTALAGS